MKYLILFLFISIQVQAQAIDSTEYEGRVYNTGDTITLGYGSMGNKDFAFITIGNLASGFRVLSKGWGGSEAVITKIRIARRKAYLNAKLLDKAVNALGGNPLLIDLAGAVDNKELK